MLIPTVRDMPVMQALIPANLHIVLTESLFTDPKVLLVVDGAPVIEWAMLYQVSAALVSCPAIMPPSTPNALTLCANLVRRAQALGWLGAATQFEARIPASLRANAIALRQLWGATEIRSTPDTLLRVSASATLTKLTGLGL